MPEDYEETEESELALLLNVVHSVLAVFITVIFARYTLKQRSELLSLAQKLLQNVWIKSPVAFFVTAILVGVCYAEDATWALFSFPRETMIYRWLLLGVLTVLKTVGFLAKTGFLPSVIKHRNKTLEAVIKKSTVTLGQLQFWQGIVEAVIIIGNMIRNYGTEKSPNGGDMFFVLVVSLTLLCRILVPHEKPKPVDPMPPLEIIKERYSAVEPGECCLICGQCKHLDKEFHARSVQTVTKRTRSAKK